MKSILIIQTAFLGDVILATPVVEELSRIFPESDIDFLLKKGNEALLQSNPRIRDLYVLNKQEGKLKNIFKHIRQFRNNKYDLVINLHRFGSSGLITALSKGGKKYGFKKNPWSFAFTKSFEHEIGNGTHEVERNLSLIREFGAETICRPKLYPSEHDKEVVKQYVGSNFVCVAPASVWFTKQMPSHKWVELINQITDNVVYLIGGPSDNELCEEIKGNCSNKQVINLAGQLTIMESIALIEQAERAFVNDSGPLHMASSVNTPTTAFFCSTIPDFGFGPLAVNSEIRQMKDLNCRPCGLHGHEACPKGHFKCGNEMDVTL